MTTFYNTAERIEELTWNLKIALLGAYSMIWMVIFTIAS